MCIKYILYNCKTIEMINSPTTPPPLGRRFWYEYFCFLIYGWGNIWEFESCRLILTFMSIFQFDFMDGPTGEIFVMGGKSVDYPDAPKAAKIVRYFSVHILTNLNMELIACV